MFCEETGDFDGIRQPNFRSYISWSWPGGIEHADQLCEEFQEFAGFSGGDVVINFPPSKEATPVRGSVVVGKSRKGEKPVSLWPPVSGMGRGNF